MNYRTNEDRRCVSTTLAYNETVALSIVEVQPVIEPVLLPEAKSHLRITFTDDDLYVDNLIKSCRQALEKFTGLSLVEKLITWHVNNSRGGSEFPYGPVRALPAIIVKDSEDTVLVVDTGYELSGLDFPTLSSPAAYLTKITYGAGYTTANFPFDLKLELLGMIAFEYEHRGEQDVQYSFTNKARAHRRVPIIL